MVAVATQFYVSGANISETELARLHDDYRATPLENTGADTPLSRAFYEQLNRYAPYIQKNLRVWAAETGAEFHKADGSQEPAVRQNADVALVLAVLGKFGPPNSTATKMSRLEAQTHAAALVRYLAITHKANLLSTGDGKKWGDEWQSALWTARVGDAAWLLWDTLPDDTKVMAARMIIHEAERFNERPPDNGEIGDTKSEENAWNSEIIALAACMFQRHPNAKLWRERAIVYMFNSYSTAADHLDDRILDGKRVRDWVTTTNIHGDYTLENHDRVHPDYISCFTLMLQNAALYRLARLQPPDAMFHHVKDCNDVLMHLTATNGTLFYINGQDWWPHRHEMALIAGGLAGVLLHDPGAAALERAAFEALGKMHSRFDDGRAYNPREGAGNVEEELMAAYARNYLAHRLFGDQSASSLREFQDRQSGTRIFEQGGFATHRTAKKFVSFCWVNEIMGFICPSDDTWFTAAQERGLLGSIEAEGVKDTPPRLEKHNVQPLHVSPQGTNDGFAFVGKFTRCDGKIEQRVAVISLPDESVLYIERLRARENVDTKEVATAAITIFNEDSPPMALNQRRLWFTSDNLLVVGATNAAPEQTIWETSWANLDDKFGVTAQAGGRMSYLANHRYRRLRLTQTLAANYARNLGLRQPGEIISDAVVEFTANTKHTEHTELRVEEKTKDTLLISDRKWRVLANLADTALQTNLSGKPVRLDALNVVVWPNLQ